MKSVKKIALTAAIALATAFTFSCSSDESEDSVNTCTNELLGCPYGSAQSSSSILIVQSSSSNPIVQSSSSDPIVQSSSSDPIIQSSSSFVSVGDVGLLQNAAYETGSLPVGTTGQLDVDMSNAIISGGSTIIAVTSSRELNRLYVQFAGSSGYYVLNILEGYLVSSTGGTYVYSVPLQLTQSLLQGQTGGQTQMSFSGAANSLVSPSVSRNVEAIRVGSGALQISLSWNTKVDLDLYVTPPPGTTSIYFGRKIVGNGQMDLDANVGCPGPRDIRNENIFFTGQLADGDYTVEVNMYQNCITTPTSYAVLAYIDGEPYEFSANQIGQFAGSDKKKTIGIIRIQDGVSVPYVPSSSSVYISSSSSSLAEKLYCDCGPIHSISKTETGGGCFDMEVLDGECDLEWCILAPRCGRTDLSFCDFGRWNEDGGGCFRITDDNCDTRWGTIRTSCPWLE